MANARIVEILILAGLFDALRSGLLAWFVTFTPPGVTNWTTSDYRQRLARIRRRSAMNASLRAMASVFETFDSGELHLHAVILGPTMGGRAFRRAVIEAGFGFPNITLVPHGVLDAETVARYVAKDLPDVVLAHPSKFGAKAQPARFSRDWPAGGLTDGRDIVFELLWQRRQRKNEQRP